MLSISFSVFEVTVEMRFRSRFSPIPVLFVFPSLASFRAVWELFCLLAITCSSSPFEIQRRFSDFIFINLISHFLPIFQAKVTRLYVECFKGSAYVTVA